MLELKNEKLDKHCTLRIGGIAKNYLIPETKDELIELAKSNKCKYIIGGGSNLLISNREFEYVVDLKKFAQEIEFKDGLFEVGASVMLIKLIENINEKGYGGIEYLSSVPGCVGGAIVMNAGRGKAYNKQISDYVVSVNVIREGKIVKIDKKDCCFSYRNSIFQRNGDIIVSIVFKFDNANPSECQKLRRERIELEKNNQDNRFPNAGTTFCESNSKIMNFFRKKTPQTKSGVWFSDKTNNWLQNRGDGTFEQAIKQIKKVEFLHKILFQKIRCEYKIWY